MFLFRIIVKKPLKVRKHSVFLALDSSTLLIPYFLDEANARSVVRNSQNLDSTAVCPLIITALLTITLYSPMDSGVSVYSSPWIKYFGIVAKKRRLPVDL